MQSCREAVEREQAAGDVAGTARQAGTQDPTHLPRGSLPHRTQKPQVSNVGAHQCILHRGSLT